jgi:methylglutaconyl-CoA hydratase
MIKTQISQHVATLTLNRPEKRNALTRDGIQAMARFIQEVKQSDSVRLLIIQGLGKAFCAGMDLAEMQNRAAAENPETEWEKDALEYNQLVSSLFSLPMPTLAVLQGPVLAGGVGIVLACDLVIAAKEAFIQLPEPMRGITAAMVCPLLLHRTSVSTASYLLLSGKRITAETALGMGLIHELVDGTELDGAKNTMVDSVLRGSPVALSLTKSHLQKIAGEQVVSQINYSIHESARARETKDAREGLAAFLEKRDPAWTINTDDGQSKP